MWRLSFAAISRYDTVPGWKIRPRKVSRRNRPVVSSLLNRL
jgi:hypothetical protein